MIASPQSSIQDGSPPKALRVLPDGIPPELKERPQWVNWKYAWDGKKWTKHPYNPRSGRKASSTDMMTWSPFEDVLAAYETSRYDGIGFVFCSAAPFVGIDLDGCRDPETGEIGPEAQTIIDALSGYAETSPSGTGVHIFVRGKIERGRKRGWTEAYSCKRFFTVTGRTL
jgi:putative DNA primase/helicase